MAGASLASDGSFLFSQADEHKVKLRLCHGGRFLQVRCPPPSAAARAPARAGAAPDSPAAQVAADGSYKYSGGEFLNDSVPGSCGYAEFMYRITQKVQRAVSVKYLNPGDELDPENLTSVLGDDDLKVGPARRGGGQQSARTDCSAHARRPAPAGDVRRVLQGPAAAQHAAEDLPHQGVPVRRRV
jgi:hypothetical protein